MQGNLHIPDKTSAAIRLMSWVAILCVVTQHVGISISPDGMAGRLYRHLVYFGCAEFSVSFFFVVSGFFFAGKYDGTINSYCNEVGKRIRTLLIPYFFWLTVGAFVLGAPRGWLAAYGITSYLPVLQGLWYLKILFGLVVISPIVIRIVDYCAVHQKVTCWGLGVFGLALFADQVGFEFIPAKKPVVMSVLYFMVGCFLARHSEEIRWRLPGLPFSLVLLVVLLATKLLLSEKLNTDMVLLRWFVIPVTISVVWQAVLKLPVERVSRLPVVDLLVSSTFMAYCIEGLLRLYVEECVVAALGRTVFSCVFVPFVVMVVSAGIFYLWFKLFPRLLAVVLGGRVGVAKNGGRYK